MSRIVQARANRVTGTVIQVIDNRDGSFDEGDLDWFNLCLDHGAVCSHETRRLAEVWAAEPQQWCPDCQAIFYAERGAP